MSYDVYLFVDGGIVLLFEFCSQVGFRLFVISSSVHVLMVDLWIQHFIIAGV